MKTNDLKYLTAYSIPISALVGFSLGGLFFWLTPVFVFIAVPIFEMMLPVDRTNLSSEERSGKAASVFFDILLYLNIPLVYALLGYTLITLTTTSFPLWQLAGILFTTGLVMGSNGINVAHELGHRPQKAPQLSAKFLLMPSLYMHFYIEHNFGHHLHAATPEDPATARYNQTVYGFWFTSVFRQYFKAWTIQRDLLKREGRSFLSVYNDMLWFVVFQSAYLLLVYVIFGMQAVAFALILAVISFLLLETINYIEHYGLKRNKMTSGRYERVSAIHSWNSNHLMGRIMLYELTRHSDHHYRASKKYQLLDHHEKSPQMPFGYPTSMVIALMPPLWFNLMNRRIPDTMKQG